MANTAFPESRAPVDTGRRRPYEPPLLIRYGALTSLTLGGTPGVGDSGNPLTFRPPSP